MLLMLLLLMMKIILMLLHSLWPTKGGVQYVCVRCGQVITVYAYHNLHIFARQSAFIILNVIVISGHSFIRIFFFFFSYYKSVFIELSNHFTEPEWWSKHHLPEMDVWLFVCLMKINGFPDGGSVTAGTVYCDSWKHSLRKKYRTLKFLMLKLDI